MSLPDILRSNDIFEMDFDNFFRQRKPVRLKGYDYSRPGYYFVTICTYERACLLGVVEKDKMNINQYGKIVSEKWREITDHFNNVKLDKFIVMPNHVHGVVRLIERTVGTGHALSGKEKSNLSIIVGSYKSAVTKEINLLEGPFFKWQRSFYDHILRDKSYVKNIRQYIKNNPLNWQEDENNPDNLF